MMTVETFLRDIEDYLRRTGMSASSFGRATVGDPSLVLDLRNGRAPNLRLTAKVAAFMQAHPPETSGRESAA